MAYFAVKDFSAGLDKRKHPMTAPPGSLRLAQNCLVTRGGELAKRRSFVQRAPGSVLADTKSLAAAGGQLYVFGADTRPGTLPLDIQYQQLVHPVTPATELQRVLSYDVFDRKIYAVAQFVDGRIEHYYDGVRVADWFDGRARGVIQITSGVVGGVVTAVLVGGVDILGAPIAWAGNTFDTADDIANQINSFVSVPDYTATRNENYINISASLAGTAANGKLIEVTKTGNVDVVIQDPPLLSGGVDGTTFTPGTYAKTAQTKMYAVSGSFMHFSGITQPTKWTTDTIGAGFTNMENQDGQSEVLLALERYYGKMAIFGRRSVQIWTIDVDPTKNVQGQVLRNTGLLAPQSVEQVGDGDVFFLADSGIRSLRSRDSSTSANVNDIGTPIDDLVVPYINALGAAATAEAVGVIEPVTGRYWLAIGGTIFVFSHFATGKIAAWSTWVPGFTVTDFAVINSRVYARGGDDLYLYGGDDGETNDTTLVEVELPLHDAEKPAQSKNWSAIDLVCEGTWRVYVGHNPLMPEARELIATVENSSLSLARIPYTGEGTHASVKLENDVAEHAQLASFLMHYELGDAS